MNLRNDVIKKLKSYGIKVSANELDEYYYKFINEIDYEFSKFDGFLDLMEDDDFFKRFLSRIKVYIKRIVK